MTVKMQNKTSNRLRVIVQGYCVRWPVGGMAWHYLHYVLGLAQLGHDVYFLEDSDNYASCWDPSRGLMSTDPSYGLRFTEKVFRRVGVQERWAYYDEHRVCWYGPAGERMLDLCATADLVLNVSGVNPLRPWLMAIPVRVFIDTDPAFTQIKHLSEKAARRLALQHTVFLSFGQNIGTDGCTVPDDGFPWQPTRQPIVLANWPVTTGPADGEFRTVMQWDSYPPREHNGRHYGMKSDSFRAYGTLPKRIHVPVGLAATRLSDQTRQWLERAGWSLHDPDRLSRDPWDYQTYIQQSKAEWTVAKQGYVMTRCGWFSDRSACYLASGRPVVAQDTGFCSWLENGSGLLAFTTLEECITAIEDVNAHYTFHCRIAREIATEAFDSRKVLTQLIENVMNPNAAAAGKATGQA